MKRGCDTRTFRLYFRKVPEEKTVDNCFFKEVTEIRKNEARLRRARILTIFQEGRTVFQRKTGSSPTPAQKEKQVLSNLPFGAVSDDKSEPNASSISAKVIVFVPSL